MHEDGAQRLLPLGRLVGVGGDLRVYAPWSDWTSVSRPSLLRGPYEAASFSVWELGERLALFTRYEAAQQQGRVGSSDRPDVA